MQADCRSRLSKLRISPADPVRHLTLSCAQLGSSLSTRARSLRVSLHTSSPMFRMISLNVKGRRPSEDSRRASIATDGASTVQPAVRAGTQLTIDWESARDEMKPTPTATTSTKPPVDWDRSILVVSRLGEKITMRTVSKPPSSSDEQASPTVQPVNLVAIDSDDFTPTTALFPPPVPGSPSRRRKTHGGTKRSSASGHKTRSTTGSPAKTGDLESEDLQTLLSGREAWRDQALNAFEHGLNQMIHALSKIGTVKSYAQTNLRMTASSMANSALGDSMLAQRLPDQELQSSRELSTAPKLTWTQNLSLTWVKESAYRVELAATARLPDGTTFCAFEERLGAFTPNYLDLIGMEEPDP